MTKKELAMFSKLKKHVLEAHKNKELYYVNAIILNKDTSLTSCFYLTNSNIC